MRSEVYNLKKFKSLMKTLKFISLTLIAVVLFSIYFETYFTSMLYSEAMLSLNEGNIIILDAGHGGEDPGAIAENGVYEKDLNLAYVNEIGNLLTERGYTVIYTRQTDKLLYNENENIKGIKKISDLKNRCKIAAEYPSALFISIHMNSYSDPIYKGMQVYYSEKNEGSEQLASYIQNSVREDIQSNNNRTVKKGKDIYILENTDNVSVLIECGFLTNPDELLNLSEKDYQKRLSLSIVCGIIKYKERFS